MVEVTSRAIHSRYLLRPSPLLREITLGILGRAQRLHSVTLHGFVFLSTHYHLLLTVDDAQQLARFVGYLNSNLAREVGRLHQWPERIWGRRYEAIVVSDEEEAQVGRLHYLLQQGCKEGLVGDPCEWPGATSVPAMLDGRQLTGTWFDRTAEWRANRGHGTSQTFPQQERVLLSPLPAWASVPEVDYRRRVRSLVDAIRTDSAARVRATRRPPLGVDGVLRQDPHQAAADRARTPAPLVHAASREAFLAFRQAFGAFVAAYRSASAAWRSDPTTWAFPAGCFPPAHPFFAPATG